MRRVAWWILLLCIFAIPWEYSLDFGAPLGNIARLLGIAALLGVVLAVLQEGRFRTLRTVHWLIAAYFLWFCCTTLWSIDREASLEKVRGYFQECMIAWLIWELASSWEQVRSILCAWVAGSGVLAVLTIAKLAAWSANPAQMRFAATGWDPNDTARFLDLGFPAAGMLLLMTERRGVRMLGFLYFPAAALAVVATGSRGGAIAGLIAWMGCGALYLQRRRSVVTPIVWALPLLLLAVCVLIPASTVARLASITEQIQGGDLNQRTTIWRWGWEAAKARPFFGSGAGTFSAAAGLAPSDTAHNTALSILVEGGMVGFNLAAAILVECARMVGGTDRRLRVGTATMLAVWLVSSMVGTAAESRTTWVMVGLIAALAHLSTDARYSEQSSRSRGLLSSVASIPMWDAEEPKVGDTN